MPMNTKQRQIEETLKKIKEIDKQLIADPKNTQLKVDKAILTEFKTFLRNK